MFVQVIKGRTNDPEALRALDEKWQKEVRPTAKGYVGSTMGVTSDGSFVVIAQFKDDVSAKENSDSPAQSAWYQELQKVLDGEPQFRESSDTHLLFDGPSAKATFVQIMEGTVPDRAAAEATETPEMLEELRKARPDLLGGLRVWLGDRDYLEAAYFTSEADARKGEQNSDFDGQSMEATFGTPSYTDLPNPKISLA
jgi:hypothetical protein